MAQETYGYFGRQLHVDLGTGATTSEAIDPRGLRQYLGGVGFGARLLYDELKGHTDPLGPDNKLVFATSPLTLHSVPGGGSIMLCFKSPLTRVWGEARCGGDFGPDVRKAGFDALIVQGRSQTPVYLVVDDGEASLRPAEHLRGKWVSEKTALIRHSVGDPAPSVLCIGPAGEKRVRIAAAMVGHRAAGCKDADRRMLQSFYGIQRLALAALLRDGEVLVVGRTSARPGRTLPYCVEVLECDRLGTPLSEARNPRVRHGVEYDEEGAPKYYFILRQHPGESIIAAVRRDDYEQVEAFNPNGTRKVIHLFDPVRPEQTRGYSAFGPGLLDAQDLDRYREAEKYGAIMAASHVATIQTENPQAFAGAFAQAAATDTGADGEEYTRREFDFAPGATFVGKPGEKIDFNNPSRPSSAFSEYSYDLLQGPANALDIPPEVFAQRWAGLNYSNARTILIQFYASCWIRQGLLINHLCAPIYASVVAAAVAAGLLPASHYGRRTPELLAASWVPMVYRRWIDPAKESAGRETDLRSNVETLTDTLTELGKDPDEHWSSGRGS